MSVALALGLGTMVGWKRIVVTVGEKIGKTHLTYAQGASAEIVAMATIGLADVWAAGVHDPRAVERCRRDDGGQRVGPAMGHGQEHGDGLGVDAAGGDDDRRLAVCDLAPGVLMMKALILVPAAH